MDKNKVIESAGKLIAKNQFDKAVKEYQRILEVDPDDVRVLQKLAELYQKMKKQTEAADCFEKVAKTYAAQGFYLKAVALYKQVLKVVDRIEVNVRLAELYQQLGLIGDATKEWQTVAAHYEKAGDQKQSLDTLNKLVDLDPENVAARIRLGEQYARQDNLVEAVAELRKAASQLQRSGRRDDYLRVAERISHLDQNDVDLAKELAEHFLSRGDSKRALSKLQICFKANSRDLVTLQMLARAFQELGQISKTVSVLKELGRVHLDAGRKGEARKTYEQALTLAPDDEELKTSLRAIDGEASPAAQPAPAAAKPPAASPAVIVPAAPRQPSVASQAPARSAPPAVPPPAGAPAGLVPVRRLTPAAGAPALRPGATGVSGPASLSKLLKETEVYVKYGLQDKALEHLQKIFSLEPENTDAHEKAKTLALAAKRTADAVASLATLVRVYSERGDLRAEGARAELRKLAPDHPALGAAPAPARPAARREPAATVVDLGELEDEAAEEEIALVEPVALEEESQFERQLESAESIEEELVEAVEEELLEELDEPLAAEAPDAAASSEGASAEDAFASDLAEADFYIQSGLTDDARAILEAILLAEPEHEGAKERLAQLAPPPRPAQAPAVAMRSHEDLAAELAAELAEEVGEGVLDEPAPLDGDVLESFQVPAHEVLGEFRAKLQETLRPEDVQTHYDLGIAYKEMGLLDEAMGEFELAFRHGQGQRAADCILMLGMCEMERGDPEAAVQRFQAGLAHEDLSPEAKRALSFELAAAYEQMGHAGEALEQYESVEREDTGFRDVTARIERLGGTISGPKSAPETAAPVPAAASAKGVARGGSRVAAQGVAKAATGRGLAAAARSAAPAPRRDPAEAASEEAEPPSPPPRKNRKIGFV